MFYFNFSGCVLRRFGKRQRHALILQDPDSVLNRAMKARNKVTHSL
jgi:hypothetical protein